MIIQIKDTLYGDKIYWRVKGNLDGGKTITFWAKSRTEKNGHIIFVKCKKDGGDYWKGNVTILNVILCHPDDIVYEKIARMALRYGELEVTGK